MVAPEIRSVGLQYPRGPQYAHATYFRPDIVGHDLFGRLGTEGRRLQENGVRSIVMRRATRKDDADGQVMGQAAMKGKKVWLRVDCDFRDKTDKARFYYSTDGKQWEPLGDALQMAFDWPDFVGQRFVLFYYSTEQTGGCADFDFFRVGKDIIVK